MAKAADGIKLNSMRSNNFGKVDVTVALPMLRCQKIGWLALEGLCRQKIKKEKGLSCIEWELIVMEEDAAQFDPLGYERVMKYQARLHQVGCKTLKYFSLPDWIPLGKKLQKLARIAKGEIFVLQEADCYPQPFRIAETYELMKDNNVDWCQSQKNYCYSIKRNKIFEYHNSNLEHQGSLNIAGKTELIRQINNSNESGAKLVNPWLYQSIEQVKGSALNVVLNQSDNWKKGVDTHGLNNISVSREKEFSQDLQLWTKTIVRIERVVPLEVAVRLKALKGYVRRAKGYRDIGLYGK